MRVRFEPERFAVIFGTGIGGIGTFENEHTKLMEKGPRRVSPLFVPMMIANMAAGMIAIRYDCRGYCYAGCYRMRFRAPTPSARRCG